VGRGRKLRLFSHREQGRGFCQPRAGRTSYEAALRASSAALKPGVSGPGHARAAYFGPGDRRAGGLGHQKGGRCSPWEKNRKIANTDCRTRAPQPVNDLIGSSSWAELAPRAGSGLASPRAAPRATPRAAPRATPRAAPRATPRAAPRASPRATPASFEDTGKPRRSRPAGASWAVGYEGAGPGPPGPEAGAIARPIPLGAALAAHQATSPE
jgi:hypothetical protein